MKVEDFRLEEDNRAQQLDRLGDPDQIPLDIALLIDVSAGVNERFSFEKDAAARFLKQVLQQSDSATVYTIDRKPLLVQARGNAEQAVVKLKGIEPSRSVTAFFDTVAEAATYLQKQASPGRRRVIIVISDGEDTFSDKFRTAKATIAELQRTDTLFYSINPSGPALRLNQISQRGQNVMEEMATATGGVAFVPETNDDLDAIFRQIAAELRSQYLLQYYSTSETPSGRFMRIKVQVPKRADLRIRARQGYYMPSR